VGRVWKFGDNINTDEIIPGRFNITTDPKALAEHCLCELRPDFPSNVRPGDLIVAGNNFGTGSSREHAPIAIKAAGIKAVIAQSFARIFYRNSINVGLPVIISEGIASLMEERDELEIEFEHFLLRNTKTGKTITLQPLPPFVFKIFKAGGIVPLLKEGVLEDLY